MTKLSAREKIGYSFGDGAANFVFQTMLIFQLPFYTNVYGLTAAAAGTLLLIGRFWDAIFDPFMGTLADRTNTRWGKFRPWVLWSAIPFAGVFVLVFTTPHFCVAGKIIYAYMMYIPLMTLYSVNNTPYSALNGVLTADVADYSEWKTKRRATGLVFSGISFALKAGLGFGDALCGWVLTAYGYNNLPDAVRTPHAIFGIQMASSIYPALTFFAGFVAILFYGISKTLNLQIQDKLEERRKGFEYG